jgi:hypothetical protein
LNSGPEALDLLMALNAGCSGMAAVHANSARDALEKLVSYSVLAGQNIAPNHGRGHDSKPEPRLSRAAGNVTTAFLRGWEG